VTPARRNADVGAARGDVGAARADVGAADVLGLVLMFPVMLGLAVLVLFLGRQVDTRSQLQAASDAAAQSAALQRGPTAGLAAAKQTVAAMLGDSDACAGDANVVIDGGQWAPGSAITVTITCTVRRSDLALIAPPTRRVSATGSALVDPNRAPVLP
jgi:Flp pilus assembly protein TadG